MRDYTAVLSLKSPFSIRVGDLTIRSGDNPIINYLKPCNASLVAHKLCKSVV